MPYTKEEWEQLMQSGRPMAGTEYDPTQRPTYTGTYDQDLLELYDKISKRPGFQYDVTKDPTYQQYKGQYIQQGKLAMKDTMGQAAGLTGGYGTSYGQQVGQQAYDAYLQKLGDIVPDLYDAAYGRYQDENDRLLQQYAMLGQQRDTEYSRWRDEMGDWERDRAWNQQIETQDYNRQQQAYAQLYALISSTGYNPTDAELAAAGMTRAAANALRNEYTRSITPAATVGGGSSGGRSGGSSSGGGGRGGSGGSSGAPSWWDSATDEQRKAWQREWGTYPDGIWGPNTAAAYQASQGGSSGGTNGNGLSFSSQREFDAWLKQQVENGTITMKEATDLRDQWSRSVVR